MNNALLNQIAEMLGDTAQKIEQSQNALGESGALLEGHKTTGASRGITNDGLGTRI